MRRCDADPAGWPAVARGTGPALVLLHGFTGRATEWGAHLDRFATRFRVLAVDLPGHGANAAARDPGACRMERCVDELAALLDRRGLARAHVLGYSLGGRVALAFAVAHPARVERLVLESASPGIADPAERRARREADAALAARLERDGIAAFVDRWEAQPLFATQVRLDPATRSAAHTARLENDAAGLAASLRGMGAGAQEPLWERLPAVTAPTLLVVGELDGKFRDLAVAMAARLPRAQVAIVPGAGHNTHLENPTVFTGQVGVFLL